MMAAQSPNDPPDSVIIEQFLGLRNTVSSERLRVGELEVARNVDIDDRLQPRRRRGQTKVLDGNYHSLYRGSRLLVVKDGVLGEVHTDYTFEPIADVGNHPLSYVEVSRTVYYTSSATSGKILSDNTPVPWGIPDGTTWLSPVIRPTDTLGAVRGKLVGPPPRATAVAAWNGRIYLAHDNVLWATELFMFDVVDRTRNYISFDGNITALGVVDDGIYVGTDAGLMFLSGVFSSGLAMKQLTTSPVVPRSMVEVPVDATRAEDQMSSASVGVCLMALTENGVLNCAAGGEVTNMTAGRMVFPRAESAAVLYREDSGANHYVAVARSSGGPTSNARIGDFADAEIRRS